MFQKKRVLLFLIATILLVFPIVYLLVKSAGKPDLPKQQSTLNSTPQTDIALLESKVKENPSYDNLIALAVGYIGLQQPGKSIDPLKRALELNPKSEVAYNDLGCAYTMLMQYQDGIDACNKALELAPDFQLAKNNLKWATDEKEKIIENIKTQENVAAGHRDTRFLISYGLNYLKIGNYDKSIEIWSIILKTEPNNTDVLNYIGVAYMLKKKYREAIIIFKRAVDKNPENTLGKNNLAWAMDELEKAVK